MSGDYVHLLANISDFCVICRICSIAVDYLVRNQPTPIVFGSMPVLVALLPATRHLSTSQSRSAVFSRKQGHLGQDAVLHRARTVLAIAISRSPLTVSQASRPTPLVLSEDQFQGLPLLKILPLLSILTPFYLFSSFYEILTSMMLSGLVAHMKLKRAMLKQCLLIKIPSNQCERLL
ncbi:unnamed protein product [Nezara viridula]|uniref:Uncharacterized protein n=1 Tax=Nezara viridula TaxID=85310 RepID=A0A9P0HKC8_NEZVI|nr:unnamed protein product [Nezara viridula]